MTVAELRQAYLEFFRARGHRVFPSDSLIPHDDPSLLFTGAGMNQFKPYFLGFKKDLKRAASCQKCLRTADLERVGKTGYHHSFFEMLGNFSFGDYFKKEAIVWGWEFVTKILKLDEKKLWVSVYGEDDQARGLWKKEIGLPDAKIVSFGADDNFWPANAPKDGPNGPCGPCSEIYVGETPGKGVEIWNLVFTQFDRQDGGGLAPLPQKNIDTGMGLERTASVLQGVKSNFDIDLFQEFRKELRTLFHGSASAGRPCNESEARAHENAVMDHARAAVFCVADGASPSNEGRGYVVRKLIRLGCDHLIQAGAKPGRFKDLVPMVAARMGNAYPELNAKQKEIFLVIENEERSFNEVVRTQVPKLKEALRTGGDPESTAFKFYDTHGLPFETISATASTLNIILKPERFNILLEEQKGRSRASSKISGEIFKKSGLYALAQGLPATEFLGYHGTGASGKLLRVIEPDLWVFDRTPFYAQAGGQVGDTGRILGPGLEADVLDTQAHERIVLHKVALKKGAPEAGKVYELRVDAERRADVMNNHTGTHLLHAALRKILGEHVKQAGSLVAPDYLRFDFTHFKALTADELSRVEAMVNEEIRRNTALRKEEMTRQEAALSGAIAFFGEKYGDRVRVVSIGDFSKEFCGGTHLASTGQIEQFKITSESSIQAGARRIEAVTGRWARKRAQESEGELAAFAREFGVGRRDLACGLEKLKDRVRVLRQRASSLAQEKLNVHEKKRLEGAPALHGVKVVRDVVKHDVPSLAQEAARYLQKQGTECAALIATTGPSAVSFVVSGTSGLVGRGFRSNEVIRSISPIVGGKGGGRPDFAVGGGKEVARLEEALKAAEKQIVQFIESTFKGAGS